MLPALVIRAETPLDRDAIFRVNRDAFGRHEEARLVDALRRSTAFIAKLSLVAVVGAETVGHVLFTRLVVSGAGQARPALALAPLAVLSAFQRRGVGSALVARGLAEARRLGHEVVIVLGHPEYYRRFGFSPAGRHGIRTALAVRDDAFMVLELRPDALSGVQGMVQYPPEFAEV